jgi:hypothetical protein
MAVSIAAQIFIVPVLLKQFHQFPVTFMASSLVAMPASYVVIFGALFNVALSTAGIDWLWPLYEHAGNGFLLTMKWLAGLNPTMHFSLPVAGSICLMGMAILFSVALVYRWPPGKKIAYVCGVLALFTLGCHRTVQWNQDDLVIYHHYKGLLIDIIIDGRCTSIQDSNLTGASIEFAARGYRCHRDVINNTIVHKHEAHHTATWTYNTSLLRFQNALVLIWNGDSPPTVPALSITHLIIDHCPDVEAMFEFIRNNPPELVILPVHLDRYKKNATIKFLKTHQLDFHDISQQGYFKLQL